MLVRFTGVFSFLSNGLTGSIFHCTRCRRSVPFFFLYLYFSCPSSSSSLLSFSPSHIIHRLGFCPFRYRHGGGSSYRNLCKLSFSSHYSPKPSLSPLPRRGRRGGPPTSGGGAEAEVDRSGGAEGAARRSPLLAPVRGHNVTNVLRFI